MIYSYISYNDGRRPVTKNFTTFHYTSRNYTSLHYTTLHLLTLYFFSFRLHPTTPHYSLIWLNPISISYRSISPHIIFMSSAWIFFPRF